MGPFVLDTSVAVSWGMRDEAVPRAASTAGTWAVSQAMHAPVFLWYELRNALLIGVRRGRVSLEHVQKHLQDIAALRLHMHPPSGDEAVLELAQRRGLTIYDAAYLELAIRMRLPLATLDGTLAKAAKSEGVELIG